MALSSMKAATASQKAVTVRPAKAGKMAAKLVARNTAKTKLVAKATAPKGKKITGPRKGKSVPTKGKPISKKTAKRVVRAR
jgi:hypothetical protein